MAHVSGNAVAQITRHQVDFGQVNAGGVAQVVYHLKNDSSERLKVKSIQPECGCMDVRSDRESIKPGESAKLTIAVEGLNLESDFNKSIMVVFEGDKHPKHLIEVKGLFKATDHRLFGFPKISKSVMKVGEQRKFIARVMRNGRTALGELKIEIKDPRSCQVELVRSTDSSLYYEVTVIGNRPGDFKNEIKFIGKNEDDFLRLPVRSSVSSQYTAYPSRIYADLARENNGYLLQIHGPKGLAESITHFWFESEDIELLSFDPDPNDASKWILRVKRTGPTDRLSRGTLFIDVEGDDEKIAVQIYFPPDL